MEQGTWASLRLDSDSKSWPNWIRVVWILPCATIGARSAFLGDLRETLPQVIAAYQKSEAADRLALLAACPPCQGMSSAQSSRGAENDPDVGSQDRRNLLVQVIVSAVRALEPRVVVVENVQAFLTADRFGIQEMAQPYLRRTIYDVLAGGLSGISIGCRPC